MAQLEVLVQYTCVCSSVKHVSSLRCLWSITYFFPITCKTLIDFLKPWSCHRAAPPHSPLVYTYLAGAPRPWQQLVLRFGWELITPWWSPAKRRGGFFKGSKLRFSLFRTGKSDSMRRVISSMCRVCVCHQQSSLVPPPNLEITSVPLHLMNSPLLDVLILPK